MLIEIADLFYELPDGWEDLTLNQFLDINKITEEAPKDDASDKDKLNFQIKFISHFNIPEEALKSVKLYDATEKQAGIVNIFEHLWKFTQLPTNPEFIEFNKFKLNDITYCFNTNTIDLSGGDRPLTDYTFIEYEEANGVLQAMQKLKEGQLDTLALLTAIFFRPAKKKFLQVFKSYDIEPYDEATVYARSEVFKKELSMDKVWSAYFFLLNRIAKSRLDTAHSLLAEVEKSLS